MKNPTEVKWYEGRKRVKDFIVVVRGGKIVRVKKFPKEEPEPMSGYILPRKIDELDKVRIDQCSDCDCYFPDGLNSCDHCGDDFCCDCADQHRDEIADEFSTGGCNY